MSQNNLHAIIQQQQEQLAAMQAQIQALLVAQGGAGVGGEARGSNMGSHMEVAKPAIFNGEAAKVGGFITAYRLFLRMKLRGATVEEQVQWVLSYVQGGSADVWKENMMEELESGEVEYESTEEFLTSLKKEFRGGRRRVDKSGGTEEDGARREDDGRICSGVQKSGERKWVCVRHGSHRGGSLQDGLGNGRTCGTTLASAYMLHHLSAT